MSNQDIIFINDLKIETIIGVNAWERELKQTVVIDLELYTDITPAAKSDDLSKTIDYQLLHDNLIEVVGNSKFELIEALAECIANECLQVNKVKQVKVTLKKPGAIKQAKNVGISILRSNNTSCS